MRQKRRGTFDSCNQMDLPLYSQEANGYGDAIYRYLYLLRSPSSDINYEEARNER